MLMSEKIAKIMMLKSYPRNMKLKEFKKAKIHKSFSLFSLFLFVAKYQVIKSEITHKRV
jgi:hypothetical protein